MITANSVMVRLITKRELVAMIMILMRVKLEQP
jgi:hypothetical protein